MVQFSVSAAPCRDTNINCDPGAFNVTSTLIGQALDIEKPDLVIFTGDQLNGQGSAWDAKSILAKFAYEVTSRQIPWAAVFGNHDDEDARETGWKKDQIKMMQAMPYSLVQAGPEDVHGEGNYVLKVLSADASKTHLLTMYFLDSGSYSKGFIDWFGFFTPTEYDWIHEVRLHHFSLVYSRTSNGDLPTRIKSIGSCKNRVWSLFVRLCFEIVLKCLHPQLLSVP